MDCLLDAMKDRAQWPYRIFTDSRKTIHLGTLASWGGARGIKTELHAACTSPHSVMSVMRRFAEFMNDPTIDVFGNDNVVTMSAKAENWRLNYNNSLKS